MLGLADVAPGAGIEGAHLHHMVGRLAVAVRQRERGYASSARVATVANASRSPRRSATMRSSTATSRRW